MCVCVCHGLFIVVLLTEILSCVTRDENDPYLVRYCDRFVCNNNNNIHICIAPYGRNFRGAGPGSVLVGVRRGKRVSLGEEKCL